jgi:hypothetical protein
VQRGLPAASRGALCIHELLERRCRRPISRSSPADGIRASAAPARERSFKYLVRAAQAAVGLPFTTVTGHSDKRTTRSATEPRKKRSSPLSAVATDDDVLGALALGELDQVIGRRARLDHGAHGEPGVGLGDRLGDLGEAPLGLVLEGAIDVLEGRGRAEGRWRSRW